MSNEQNNASPVEFGCHCDLEPGMPPDGCVLDEGKPENCVHARRFSSKEQCAYWKPITPPAAAPAPAVPQGEPDFWGSGDGCWVRATDKLARPDASRFNIPLYAAPSPNAVPLSAQELDLCRQWFDAVRDLNPAYLERADYVLGMRLYQVQGMRVPKSVVAPSQGPVTLSDHAPLLEEVASSLEDYKNGAPWGAWDRERLDRLYAIIAALREKEGK